MDDVLTELLADGVLSNRDVDEARTRLAQKLMRFASSGRSVIQIWQLLSRALRNEQSSARHRMTRQQATGGLAAAKYSRDVNETLRPPVTGPIGEMKPRLEIFAF